jgi:hypothetical protein
MESGQEEKMLKTLATAAGMVLLTSSFALAGQSPSPTAPQTHAQVTARAPHAQTRTHHRGKKHHRKHHKRAAASQRR